ncbi:MAG TPA: hypothetical protein VF940_18915 [Streptosporangiaceae bacterium]
MLLVLFVPDEEVVFRNQAGAELAGNAHRFVSRLAATRFLGYLRAQKAAITGQAGAHTNGPELVAVHGYDTKYAMHALRLGLQGVEFLTTGRITLPVPEPHRAYLRSISPGESAAGRRPGRHHRAETQLTQLRETSPVPDQPDRGWVDDWLHRSHLDFWARHPQSLPERWQDLRHASPNGVRTAIDVMIESLQGRPTGTPNRSSVNFLGQVIPGDASADPRPRSPFQRFRGGSHGFTHVG